MTDNGAPAPRDVLRIRLLNDAFRTTLQGGRVFMTPGINALSIKTQAEILKAVVTFTDFNPDNDPYGEHDFLSVEVDGLKVFAKHDSYDLAMEYGSPDPTNPAVTVRVLTIMLASEY